MIRRPMTAILAALAVAAGALLLPGGVSAHEGDARWLPWVGCWEPTSAEAGDALMCFRPDGEGVELLTVTGGEVTSSEALRADGLARERSAEGCSGSDVVAFSDDGRRIFMTSDQVCEGGVQRSASGIISMVSPTAWIDVKSVDVEGERLAMVQLYRLVEGEALEASGLAGLTAGREMAVRTARVAAASTPTAAQVVEASARVDELAVQAWLAEAADPFSLSAGLLERLADAGVPPTTIDVMVAVSYPDRFVLDREARLSAAPPARGVDRGRDARDAYGMYRGSRSPFYWDPFFMSAYGYRYGYLGYGGGYGAPGYGYYPYGGWLGYRPTIVVVEPESSQRGRVVNGQGYTRGRTGGASPSGVSYPTGRSGTVGAPSRGSTGSAGASTATPPPTRKAKPRGGGGGGETP
jgi:hypothetical protein